MTLTKKADMRKKRTRGAIKTRVSESGLFLVLLVSLFVVRVISHVSAV